MPYRNYTKNIPAILNVVLMLMMFFTLVGCSNNQNYEKQWSTKIYESVNDEIIVLGEGQTKIIFTVVDEKNNETTFEIYTDKETVGDALFEHELIAGEDGDYGLYIRSVNGITAIYEDNQTYWAFYINDEYAMSGVDTTQIEAGTSYALKVEK